jgi:cytochrome P450
LNEYALLIKENLVRLQNGNDHTVARKIAMQLHQCMWPVDADKIVASLIKTNVADGVLDWVSAVAKQLPVRVLLKSLGFEEVEEALIAAQLPVLATIMLPHKTPEQVDCINAVAEDVYRTVATHLLAKGLAPVDDSSLLPLYVSNCIGLFIQSYDAGRGLLCNALLAALQQDVSGTDTNGLRQLIIETLRFNPPVHNTRRVAVADIALGDVTIREGDMMLVVLAAANRDPLQFAAPDQFDMERTNNRQYLSFGVGIHACIADHFITLLLQDCLLYFVYPLQQSDLVGRNAAI